MAERLHVSRSALRYTGGPDSYARRQGHARPRETKYQQFRIGERRSVSRWTLDEFPLNT